MDPFIKSEDEDCWVFEGHLKELGMKIAGDEGRRSEDEIADGGCFIPSKADKNSIVRSAAVYMRELKGTQEALRRRNEELKARLKGVTAGDGGERIRITVANPSSAIDSFIGALRCLKSMDVKASSIRSDFSGEKLSAVVNFETNNKASATELEKAVEGAMEEVEQKFRTRLPRSSGWSRHCHVENTL